MSYIKTTVGDGLFVLGSDTYKVEGALDDRGRVEKDDHITVFVYG